MNLVFRGHYSANPRHVPYGASLKNSTIHLHQVWFPSQNGPHLMTLGLKLWALVFCRSSTLFKVVYWNSSSHHAFPLKPLPLPFLRWRCFRSPGPDFFWCHGVFCEIEPQQKHRSLHVHFPLYWSFHRDHLFLHQLWFFQGFVELTWMNVPKVLQETCFLGGRRTGCLAISEKLEDVNEETGATLLKIIGM